MNDVVQQNSSISEETASASEDLFSQADLLMNLMNQFQLDSRDISAASVTQRTFIEPEITREPVFGQQQVIQAGGATEDKKRIVLDSDAYLNS